MVAAVALTVKGGVRKGVTYVVEGRKSLVIGRAKDCEVRLPAFLEFSTVSRHHCFLDVRPTAVRVCDLGSRNGTCINGVRLPEPSPTVTGAIPPGKAETAPVGVELKDGDELSLGGATFEVHIDPQGGPAAPEPSLGESQALAASCDDPPEPVVVPVG